VTKKALSTHIYRSCRHQGWLVN